MIPFLATRLLQIFVCATTAQLSCYVKNYVAITGLEFEGEPNDISIKFEVLWQDHYRDHCEYGLSQWNMTLQCNAFSHWLSAYQEWPLHGSPCKHVWEYQTTMQYLMFVWHKNAKIYQDLPFKLLMFMFSIRVTLLRAVKSGTCWVLIMFDYKPAQVICVRYKNS